MPIKINDNLTVTKFTVKVEGEEPFTVDAGAPDLKVKITESSKYVTTIHFTVTGAPVKGFHYKQVVKKAILSLKLREIDIGDFEPSDTEYTFDFPEDTTPGGFLLRGNFPIVLTYSVGGKELVTIDWTTEVVAKK